MDAPEKSGSGEESEFSLRCQCHGAYKRKRERIIPTDVPDILFIQNIPTLPFDDASGGQLPGGQKDYLVMFVGKMHRRAPDLYKVGKQ